MRKLLLVMLAPVLILGVMGCDKVAEDIQTDNRIQNEWQHEFGLLTLHINASSMVVKYNGVSTPYRTEFVDTGGNTAQGRRTVGDMTMFRFKDDVKLATFHIVYDASSYPTTLKISDTEWIDVHLKAGSFPFDGTYVYINIPLTTPNAAMFKWDEEEGKIIFDRIGKEPAFTVLYEGIGTTDYGPSQIPPTTPGRYIATINVIITVAEGKGYASGGPFEIGFTIRAEDIIIDNPQFILYGGLGSGNGNTANFEAGQSTPAAMLYLFPPEVKSYYARFKVYYTVEKLPTGEPGNDIKLTFKSSKSNIMSDDVDKAYPSHFADGDYTYTSTLAAYDNGLGGFSIHHNRGNPPTESADFTITVTRIEFTAD